MITQEQEEAIEAAEVKVQRIYENGTEKGTDLLAALKELQLAYFAGGEISNKSTMVNSLYGTLTNVKRNVFMSSEERVAKKKARDEMKRLEEEEKVKQELYDDYLKKQKSSTASKKK